MLKYILLAILILNSNLLKGQHLPCYHIWSESFERLSLQSEFATIVEFDVLQEPHKAKTIKIDYAIIADSISDLSQNDYFSFDEISQESKLSTGLSIKINYGENGTVNKISYFMVSYFLEKAQTLEVDSIRDNKYIRLILNEEEYASLNLLKEEDNLYWQFATNRDTFYLESIKKKDIFFLTRPLKNPLLKGQTLYKYNTQEYNYFKKLVDSVILDETPIQYAGSLKKSFHEYCQKEIIYDENQIIKSIFMLNQMKYVLVEFKTDSQKNLSSVTSKTISGGEWVIKKQEAVRVDQVDSKGNWTQRKALYSIGKDFRAIEYYEK